MYVTPSAVNHNIIRFLSSVVLICGTVCSSSGGRCRLAVLYKKIISPHAIINNLYETSVRSRLLRREGTLANVVGEAHDLCIHILRQRIIEFFQIENEAFSILLPCFLHPNVCYVAINALYALLYQVVA